MKKGNFSFKRLVLLTVALLGVVILFAAGNKPADATSTDTVTEQIQFQAPNANTQYYAYLWNTGTTLDSTFVPLTENAGIDTYSFTMPASTTSYNFFITTSNTWPSDGNSIKILTGNADSNNGFIVTTNGLAKTAYVSSAGWELAAASSTSASDNDAAFALADEYQAAQQNDFTAFDQQWAYEGSDLGFSYSSTSTTFKVWAPTATSVQLISYGTNDSPSAPQVSSTAMTRGLTATPSDHTTNNIGVWSVSLPGDQNGLVYQYQLTFADGTVSDYAVGTPNEPAYGTLSTASVTNTTNDPYSIAVTEGGLRSVVESPASIASNLSIKNGSAATWRVSSPTQAIVDEVNVRDFTESAMSGVSAANQGKFLGVIQSGTTDPTTGTATGFDYMKNEGFNYIQLMPVSEFASVPETGIATAAQPDTYNWGYDPENEMVPEGEYSSDPVNPVTRINEMKEMVQGLHSNNMGVIMDMVLNHVYSQTSSAFEQAEPGYYFRKYTQSGCGNDTASNHEMFGKFIIDSVTYWAKNYDIDGFRFDEMSLLDTTTMSKLRTALTAIDPNIIMYGEGWGANSDDFTPTDTSNFQAVPGIGFFNAGERDNIRGLNGQAFVDGNTSQNVDTSVADALLASGGWSNNSPLENFLTPSQSVNYVECHDNLNLNDQLWSNDPNDSVAKHDARDELANAVNIMADGITFMENGQEFDQSKLVDPLTATTVTPQSAASQPWNSAAWGEAANSYNGLMAFDGTNYFGGQVAIGQYPTTYYVGDAVNEMDWDNVSSNQSAVSFIGQLMKFKEANPQFWTNDYTVLFGTNSPMTVTSASNGVITMELKSGSTDYLVVFNASGNSITVGNGGYYGSTNLTGKTLTLTDDANLSSEAGQALTTSSVTLSNLTATIIQLS